MRVRRIKDTPKVSKAAGQAGVQKDMCHLHGPVQCEKARGTPVHVGIHPSKVAITRLKLDKDRGKILEHKAPSPQVGKEAGKYKEELIYENTEINITCYATAA